MGERGGIAIGMWKVGDDSKAMESVTKSTARLLVGHCGINELSCHTI